MILFLEENRLKKHTAAKPTLGKKQLGLKKDSAQDTRPKNNTISDSEKTNKKSSKKQIERRAPFPPASCAPESEIESEIVFVLIIVCFFVE